MQALLIYSGWVMHIAGSGLLALPSRLSDTLCQFMLWH